MIYLIIIILFFLIPTAIAGAIGAPLAITRKKQVEKIIEKAGIKETDIFCELGTGTGRMMIKAYQKTHCKVIGFEMSPLYYLITLVNLKINKVKDYKLHLKNFFKADFSEANVIFVFLMPEPLKKLKFKKGQKVVSYCFPIESLKPYYIMKEEKQLPVYYYQI